MEVTIKGIGLQGAVHGLKMFHEHTLRMAESDDLSEETVNVLAQQEKWIVQTYNNLNLILQSFQSQEEVNAADILIRRH